jgi:DNA-binding transcriptional ArsR family regulator
MIDRIRQDIQDRLDQLLAEADRLRQALSALGGETRQAATRSSGSGTSSRARSRASTASASRRRGSSATGSRTRSAASSPRRSSGTGTKSSVLRALADAIGSAMTASEVASATGLGRASVSTTLSKLAKSGEVTKAQRGYQLSASGSTASSSDANGAS